MQPAAARNPRQRIAPLSGARLLLARRQDDESPTATLGTGCTEGRQRLELDGVRIGRLLELLGLDLA